MTLAAVALAGCGEESGLDGGVTTPGAPTRIPTAPSDQVLAIGVDEADAQLVSAPGSSPAPAPVEAARKQLSALAPTYYRLRVNWADVQPDPHREPDWTVSQPGCRDVQPCLPYAGVRAQLRAVRTQQEENPGTFQVVVVLGNAPGWATGRPRQCPPGTPATAPTHTHAYRHLVASLIRLADKVGVALPWWSAWDEPNHPDFLSPQRCGGELVSDDVYANLVRELRRQLNDAPGEQRIVLGDTAAIPRSTETETAPVDFITALPEDVACVSDIWGEHGYVLPGESLPIGRGAASLDRVITALDAHVCDRRQLVWITETGVGATHTGEERGTTEQDLSTQCEAMAQALQAWYDSPRVDAAFHYTFRQDPAFQVGLLSADLETTFPTYDLWHAWGARRPDGPAPLDNPCP